MFKLFLWTIFFIAILNTVLLAFAFRDFSFPLLGQFILTAIGLPLSSYLLFKQEPNFLVITEEEEKAEEYQLEGRFCLNHLDLN